MPDKAISPSKSAFHRRGSRSQDNNGDVLLLRASRESRESLRSKDSSQGEDALLAPKRVRMLKSSSINTITGILPSRVSSGSIKTIPTKENEISLRFGYLSFRNQSEDNDADNGSDEIGDDDDDDDDTDQCLDNENDELMANVNRSGAFNATVVSPAQDMWSFGVVLYNLVVNAPLFLEDNDGNVIQKSDLEALLEWKDDVKLLKLSAVKDLYARNLISLLLTKDPSKRITMEKVLVHPFLNPGMRPARLEGDPPEYDVFISYRVLTDSYLAEALYNELTARGLSVFWDKMCLQDGELWEDGFCRGSVKSRIFLPIFSKDAMRNQSLPRLNWENLQPTSAVDNVLLEHRLAIEMMSRGLLEKIYPVFAGPRNSPSTSPVITSDTQQSSILFEKYNFCDTMDGESCFPACSDIVVTGIEAKFADHLDRQGLGLTLSGERLSVKTIVSKISQYQGKALEGPMDVEVKKVVDSVYAMCTTQNLPFSRPTLDSLSSFSVTSFNNYASPSSIDTLTRKEAFKTILDNFAGYLESLNTPPDVVALMRAKHERLYETEDPNTFLSHFSSLYGINLIDSIPGLGGGPSTTADTHSSSLSTR
jgi:serine/threonine protein kinase